MHAFQSESTLYSCLNVKELLARSRHEIGSLSDCNWTRTHNHLGHKQTLNNLAKLARGPAYPLLGGRGSSKFDGRGLSQYMGEHVCMCVCVWGGVVGWGGWQGCVRTAFLKSR